MKISSFKVSIKSICFFFLFSFLILACSKDSDVLDAVLIEETNETIFIEDAPVVEENYVQRFKSFPPIHDAYVQSGRAFNQNIMRLEQDSQTGYLMFDLSPIAEINGIIKAVTLQVTIKGSAEKGAIKIYQGASNEWSEVNLTEASAPNLELELGSIETQFFSDETEYINLQYDGVGTNLISLILTYEGESGIALATKEHEDKIGPKLVVTYEAPEGAAEITFEEEVNAEETEEVADESSEEETSNEEVETEDVAEENNAPIAVAEASPLVGIVPLTVNFQANKSTDDDAITTYTWDFKDGGGSSNLNPSNTFTEAGTYPVTLTVTDTDGLSNTKTVIITVNEPENEAPIAIVNSNVTTGEAPLTINFIGSQSTDDDAVTSYAWDFKDGGGSSDMNPSNTFSEAGSYEVSLTVTDTQGLTNTKTLTINVNEPVNEPPVAIASSNITTGEAPLTVNFTSTHSTDDNAIVSYSWNFLDGNTSNEPNPSHTFQNPGTYMVEFVVTDANGLSDTDIDTIIVTEPVSLPPGYYVATDGNASNDGLSPTNAWTIEHAVSVAKAGDVIHVKAGYYGNKQLITKENGLAGNPIRFVGYKDTPGDIVSNQGPTHNYGDQITWNKMPLFEGVQGQGTAITVYHKHIEFENFQITGYQRGVLSIDQATNLSFKNIIISETGNQNNTAYDGFGFNLKGNYAKIENCYIYNATAEAINLADADYSEINYTKAYSDNYTNPTDYYFVLTTGTNNTIIQNSYAERVGNLPHPGHGFDIKDLGEYNTIKNCVAKNTTFELNFSGVRNNTIDGGRLIGNGRSLVSEVSVQILNGANNNVIKNMTIENLSRAITWKDNDDGFTGANGDRDATSLGYDNTFHNLTVKNVDRILNVGFGTNSDVYANGNSFTNCNFSDFNSVALVYNKALNTLFRDCSFANGNELVIEVQGQHADASYFEASWENCNWSNFNFTPPN